MSNETTDPRQFAHARARLRRYADLLTTLDKAVEAEEYAEAQTRRNAEADAHLAETQRQAEAVTAEAAAHRAKLDAQLDKDLAEKRGELVRLDAVIATKNAEAQRATERADAAQARCRQWVEAESKLAGAAA